MSTQPQQSEAYPTRPSPHPTSCACGGTGRALRTRVTTSGQIVANGTGICPVRVKTNVSVVAR